ncbi:tricarboxylate transporter [Pseudazoarcus pumilus]|uniref:Tricarboxylate transporter n=2 Tax=Pseudazoarcus pumilus TaxID=2067960 RepID=A0A2I6S3F4_9RHOO|nr:tricarboxylate transporter [Pseudazoarcus pumilus]
MEELNSLMGGMAVALTPMNVLLMFVGVFLGVLMGVLPGLGGANGIAILLPLTFNMDPVSAVIMLSCIYWGSLFGGAITAIVFNIPGCSYSVATTFDGYPMAKKGMAGEALTTSFTASFFGALFAIMLITFIAPTIADFALSFGPPEFFGIMVLTFCAFLSIGKEAAYKTLAAMMLGFALASVGIDIMTGAMRLTFGTVELMRGFEFLIVVIGLFGLGEILVAMEDGLKFQGVTAKIDPKIVLKTWGMLGKHWANFARSMFFGACLGVVPGGATPASFLGYGIAKRFSKDGDNFGTGSIDGLIGPETANNAAGTAALLPMLTLGIPGSPTAAVLLGGLMIWGLQPGPLLFAEQPDFVWGLIASMYLGNLAALILCLTTVPLFAAILKVPFTIIAPIILTACSIGAFTVANAMGDVWYMLIFGIVGYIMKKLKYPLAPMVLAVVLGGGAENGFRQAMLMSNGNLGIFYSNPIVGTIITLALILAFLPLVMLIYRKVFVARKLAAES